MFMLIRQTHFNRQTHRSFGKLIFPFGEFITPFVARASIAIEEHCLPDQIYCAPNCSDEYSVRPGQYVRRQNCRCDTNCVVYADCCVDYLDHCSANGTDPLANRYDFSPHLVCVSPYDPANEVSYLAVGRCPLQWPMDDVRQNCENETLARSQRFLTLLVNGPDDIVFKNVYCAICHHVTDPVPWSLKLWDCEPAVGETIPIHAGGKPNLDACRGIQTVPPTSMLSEPHRCYHDVIDSCPETTNASETHIALCASQTSFLFHLASSGERPAVYKNVYCVNCAPIKLTGSDFLVCHLGSGVFDPAISFLVLFDFTARSVRSKNFHTGLYGVPQMIGECNLWQQYDPFIGMCRNLSCPDGRVLQMGQCVESNDQIIIQTPSSDCWQQLMSSLENAASSYDLDGELSNQAVAYVDLSVVANTQSGFDQFLSRNLTLPCNATTSLLLVASQADFNESRRSMMCEGFTQQKVAVNEIAYADGAFYINISNYIYAASEFVHITKYKIDNGNWSKNEYLTLCDPFVEDGCAIVAFSRSEFVMSGVGEDAVFVHEASGSSFNVGDVWQLPDGTLRMCNFLPGPVTYPAWITTLSDFSFAGSVCSIVILILTLITYLRFSVLRNVPGKIVMNLTVALILAQVVLVVGKTSVPWLCVARAVVLHFSWLAVFTWTSILAGDLAYTMRSMRPPSRQEGLGGYKVMKFCVVAWGFSVVFVGVCFLVSSLGNEHSSFGLEYGGSQCWIVDPTHALLVFGIPLSILLLVNCLFLVIMIYTVTANRRRLAAARMAKDCKTDILLCIKLMVVTGATWTLFLVANVMDVVIVWYLAVFVNSLQGALIGLMFLLKENTRALWYRQWLMICSCHCQPCCSLPRRTRDDRQPATVSSTLAVVSGEGTCKFEGCVEDGGLPCEEKASTSDMNTKL
ncbi:uncharacterized protein LOC119740047 [Patiria miniata]|uniref:G-protein coupled receptors family 2 profile 2 domain-containing protein n=1 Tax=Patiria miniata TaxID=46514 RepID=A0A914B4G6_PATMI|nr:uncharacterized protein LOC119740047 [Patiria miniata]